MTEHEHKLARALVAAHTAPEVAPIVLDAVDAWAAVVAAAQEALEQHQRASDDGHYSVQQLADLLGWSDTQVRRLLDNGALPYRQFSEGGSIRIPAAEVRAFLDAHTKRNAPPQPKQRGSRMTPDEQAVIDQHPWLAD